MIIDRAFFGFARTGSISDFKYPLILDSSREEMLSMNEEGLRVLGKYIGQGVQRSTDGRQIENELIVDDEIIVIRNAAALLQRSRKFVSAVMDIHEKYGFSKLIYAPGVADPYLIPVLVYMGISFFDDILMRKVALDGIEVTPLGYVEIGDADPNKNIALCQKIVDTISTSIEKKTLREIVEKYMISGKSIEILRILDSEYLEKQLKVFPKVTPYIRANDILSLGRPDLVEYRKRVSDSYKRPEGKDILLLIPCSARKPYSQSESHQRIIEALSGMRSRIHEVIVTSPVGLVPRDLEGIYPAAFYDIPVIGKWFEDEKLMINNMLSSYLKRNIYSKIIAFVKEDLNFIREALPESVIFINGSAKKQSDLDVLRKAVNDAYQSLEKQKLPSEKTQEMLSVAKFQFGDWIESILSEARVIRSYNQDMFSRAGKVIMVFNREAGKMTITKEIAPFFLNSGKYVVRIDDFKPTANIYAMGVESCDPEIRPEDEVVVAYGNDVRGVGVAKMPAIAMKQLKKGVAVKVRN
jgi:archaeosine synthase